MTQDEETDFAEKVIRLSYKCANELDIKREDIVSQIFIKWLIDKVDNLEKESHKNEGEHVDISV